MAIKLTDSRREEIKRLLLKPLKKDIESTVKEMSGIVEDFFLYLLPDDVRKVWDKYPSVFSKASSVMMKEIIDSNKYPELYQFSRDFNQAWLSVNAPSFFDYEGKGASLKEQFMQYPYFQKYKEKLEDLMQLDKKYVKLRNKVSCVLENIPTVARLKEEFPEAYNLYFVEVVKENKKEVKERPKENQCTNTEELRAELSALFKKD